MKRVEQERSKPTRNIPINLQEEIRLRAFEIYQDRGRGAGFDLEDWLQAEAEVLDGQRTQRAA